jgi:mevalonate pyrophosphate decarboxylase
MIDYPTPEQKAIISKVDDIREKPSACGAYYHIEDDESCLDGYFTAEELRRIADVMDELKKLKQ